MAVEQEISPRQQEREDPNFFALEGGGIKAEFIQIQFTDGGRLARLASGPFILRNNLWFAKASNSVQARSMEPQWYFYRALRPEEYTPFVNTDPFTQEDWEQMQEFFPDAQIPPEDSEEVPSLAEYSEQMAAAFQQAILLKSKK